MGLQISVTVQEPDASRLQVLADNMNVSPQTLIRLMIEEGIERRLGLAQRARHQESQIKRQALPYL